MLLLPLVALLLAISPTKTKAHQVLRIQPKAIVYFFVLSDCPLANAFAPEIQRIDQTYDKHHVQFHLVFEDSDLTLENAKKHNQAYKLDLDFRLDPKHQLAKRLGAAISPEAVVVSPSEQVLYRGRIDNRAVDLGVLRPKTTQHDLRLALDSILTGKPIAVSRTTAVGCFFSSP